MKAENSNINRIPNKSNISFKGYAGGKSGRGAEYLKFYPPVYKMPEGCKMYLELSGVKRQSVYEGDRKVVVWTNDESVPSFIVDDSDRDFANNSSVTLARNWSKLNNFFQDDDHAMGYRFVVKDKSGNVVDYVNDMSGIRTQGGDTYNVITKNQSIPALSGPIYHMFFNSFAPETTKKADMPNRNHFNEADTTIKNVINKLNDGVLDPYKLILSTPVFGKDEVSSNGYWTANPYQINTKIGTTEDFMDLQCALFDKGKAWIADGAFTSQGYQSPIIANVLKYGEQSPFKDWVRIYNNPVLGVLPDEGQTDAETFKHLKYRIVNSTINNENYRNDRPTYIQFYDDRLVSPEQLESDKLIDHYDKQVPEIGKTGIKDPYAISTHQDSVQHYAFEINPSKVDMKKLDKSKDTPISEIPNVFDLFQFGNFSVSRKNEAKDAEFWDGQVDLIKMNLSGCSNNDKSEAGMVQARNYLYGCATYWTKATNSALVEHIAKMLSHNQAESIRKISNAFDIKTSEIDEIRKNIADGKYNFNILKSPLNYNESDKLNDFILNEIVNFPLESIELPSDLTGIVASPYVSARPTQLKYQNFDKLDIVKGKYPDKTHEPYAKFAAVNSNMNSLYLDGIYNFVTDVLSKMETKNPIFEDDGVSLTDYGKFVARLVVPDIVKFGIIHSLYGDNDVKIVDGKIEYDYDNLKNESLSFIKQKGNHALVEDEPVAEARAFIEKLKDGFSSDELAENQKDLASVLSKRLSGLSLNDFKYAQALIDKSGAGLNWRFDAAKDIGDNNQFFNNNREYHDVLDEAVDFWKNFVANIKKENANSYTIGEITDLYRFIEGDKSGIKSDDPRRTEKINDNAGKYSNDRVAERIFVEETGMTTLTNYTYMYASLPTLLSINPDDYKIDNYGNMDFFSGKLNNFLKITPSSMASYSHVATGNHDKPRVLHAMTVDMNIFNFDNQTEHSEDSIRDFKNTIAYVMDQDASGIDYNKYSSFAIATAAKMKGTLWADGKFQFKSIYEDVLNKAIKNIAQGKYIGQNEPNLRRANAFGNDDFRASLTNIVNYAIYMTKEELTNKEAELLRAKNSNNNEAITALKNEKENLEEKLSTLNNDKNEIVNKTVAKMLEKPMKEELRIWQLMNAVTGNPTLYAGDEYAQTGYESPSKNVYVKNRGIVEHNILKEKGNQEVKDYNKHLKAIAQIHDIEGLSALSGGTMSQIFGVWCGDTWPDGPFSRCFVHNDDKGSVTFTVVTPFFDKIVRRDANGEIIKDAKTIPERYEDNLERNPKASDKIELYNLDDSYNSKLDKTITVGMKLKRVVYDKTLGKYIPDGKEYVLDKEGDNKYYIKCADGSPIIIEELASYFYKA